MSGPKTSMAEFGFVPRELEESIAGNPEKLEAVLEWLVYRGAAGCPNPYAENAPQFRDLEIAADHAAKVLSETLPHLEPYIAENVRLVVLSALQAGLLAGEVGLADSAPRALVDGLKTDALRRGPRQDGLRVAMVAALDEIGWHADVDDVMDRLREGAEVGDPPYDNLSADRVIDDEISWKHRRTGEVKTVNRANLARRLQKVKSAQ